MSRIQISFLGRAKRGEYSEAHYHFPDQSRETDRFFGLALQRHARPDRILFLGTTASMWDALMEHIEFGSTQEELREQIIDAASEGTVTAAMLEPLEAPFSQALGVACRFRLIPHGANPEKQQQILATIAEEVPAEASLILDLTHGLRHLPMIGLLSALYLEAVRDANVEGIYYGAMDLTEQQITPVLRLDWLRELVGWIQDLRLFDYHGDLGVFEKRLAQAGLDEQVVEKLRSGAFFERINDLGRARAPLQNLGAELHHQSLEGPAALFSDALLQRIDWASKHYLQDRQATFAWFHWRHGDYLRAVILGCEAFITSLVERNADPMNYRMREDAKTRFREDTPRQRSRRTAFEELMDLRNSLAHGTRARGGAAQSVLRSERTLRAEIERLFRKLGL